MVRKYESTSLAIAARRSSLWFAKNFDSRNHQWLFMWMRVESGRLTLFGNFGYDERPKLHYHQHGRELSVKLAGLVRDGADRAAQFLDDGDGWRVAVGDRPMLTRRSAGASGVWWKMSIIF